MTAGFDWQTDEEALWVDAEPPPSPPPRRRRRWTWLVAVVILLGAGSVVGWRLSRQVDAALAETELDVLASHDLRAQAVVGQDEELLMTVLSGRQPEWTAAQRLLMDRATLTSGHPLGMADDIGRVVSSTLDSELQRAELLVEQALYVSAVNQTMTLLRTDIYRRGQDRWLYAPPEDAWWEGDGRVHTDRLTIDYPARDAELAALILSRATTALARVCQEGQVRRCPSDYELRIIFSRDPLFLQVASQTGSILRGGPVLTLPAPSLVGEPRSAADRELLVQLYAQKIVLAALADLTAYPCCFRQSFFLPLADRQLTGVGLPPRQVRFPPTAQAQDLLLTADPYLTLQTLWETGHRSSPDDWLAAAAVDHLLTLSGDAVWTWQDRLLTADSLEAWLASGDVLPAEFFGGWLRTALGGAAGQAEATALGVGSSLPPAGQAATLCRTADGRAALLGLDPAGGWETLLTHSAPPETAITLTPLPDRRGAVLQQTPAGATGAWATLLWRDGELVTGFTGDDPRLQLWFSGRFDPAGRRLLMVSRDEDRGFLQFELLDVDDCAGGQCALQPVDGLPVWSPDGERTLLLRGSSLTLGDAAGQALSASDAARGQTPFWLAGDVFGFLRVTRVGNTGGVLSSDRGVFVQQLDGRERVAVEPDLLLLALPETQRPERIFLEYAAAHPQRADTLLLVASGPGREAYYLFMVNRLVGIAHGRGFRGPEVRLLAVLDMVPTQLQFAAGAGGWMSIRGVSFTDPQRGVARLVDIDGGATLRLTTQLPAAGAGSHWLEWSPDGAWVSIVGEGVLRRVAPAGGGQVWVDLPHDDCRDAAWFAPPPG